MPRRRAFPERRFAPGQHVIVTEDVQEQYKDLLWRVLTISAVYNHEGENKGGHPSFDDSMESYLYEFREFDDALYGSELAPVNVRLPQHPRLYRIRQTVYRHPAPVPWTIVELIEPRLPEHHRPPAPEADLIAISWEYVIEEGSFSAPGQECDLLAPAAADKSRTEVTEDVLSTIPPARSS